MNPSHTAVRTLRHNGAWVGALWCFVLAGATGAFFRFGMAYGTTGGLSLANVRHAHSHLMYFGWATPALALLMLAHLPALTGRPLPRRAGWIPVVMLVTGLLAFPLFLAYGYTPAVIGGRRLPLSVMSAGLNVLGWYLFAGVYARMTRGVARNGPLVFWDIALVFLVFATFGAWGLALMKPLGVEAVFWQAALTHLFLDLFSEGWFVMALLGLVYAVRDASPGASRPWSLWLIVSGLPLMFVFGMQVSLVPPGLALLARGGGLLVATGLLANVWVLWRTPGAGGPWRLPLALLALKAMMLAGFSLLPQEWWAGHHGLRILYLHVMLLGFVTPGVVAVAERTPGLVVGGRRWLYGAVVLVLVSLWPLTSLWPKAWAGTWALEVAAWTALLPVVAGAGLLLAAVRRRA